MSEENRKLIKAEWESMQGQFVLCWNEASRLIGIVEDEWDYYYCLYDGREVRLHSCLSRITPLKGFIKDDHYAEMIRIAKLNHWDQIGELGTKTTEEMEEFVRKHKEEILSGWDENTKFIHGPVWDLN